MHNRSLCVSEAFSGWEYWFRWGIGMRTVICNKVPQPCCNKDTSLGWLFFLFYTQSSSVDQHNAPPVCDFSIISVPCSKHSELLDLLSLKFADIFWLLFILSELATDWFLKRPVVSCTLEHHGIPCLQTHSFYTCWFNSLNPSSNLSYRWQGRLIA